MTPDECRRQRGRKSNLELDRRPGSMDEVLIAEAAEDEYTASLTWYAARNS
jgi:plasmid stabilization system protein ParE